MSSFLARLLLTCSSFALALACGGDGGSSPPPDPLQRQLESRIEVVKTSDFDRVAAGGHSTARYEIRSTGTAALGLLGAPPVTLQEPGPFAVSLQPATTTLQPGESAVFELSFSPEQDGTWTGSLVVANDSPGEPQLRLPISATASAEPIPELDLRRCGDGSSLEALGFGTLLDSFASRACISVRNDGDAPLRLEPPVLTAAPAFTLQAWTAPVEIAPGGEQSFEVAFAPDRPGAFSGTLSISSNDPDEALRELEVRGEAAIDDAWVLHFLLRAQGEERDAKIAEYQQRAAAYDEANLGLGILLALRHTFIRAEADAFAAEAALEALREPVRSAPLALVYRGMTFSFISGIKQADGGMSYADGAATTLAEAVAKAPNDWFLRFDRGVTLVNMADGIMGNFWANLIYGEKAKQWKETGRQDLLLVRQEHETNRIALFDKDSYDRQRAPVPDDIMIEVDALLDR